MNARKRAILNAIERAPQTAYGLSQLTGAPQPSVRRLVQSLRNEGHDISYAFIEEGGFYRYASLAPTGTDDSGNSMSGN